MAPFPHPAHRTGQADFPHPALGQDFTLSRATPSAASEHLLELIGFPISRSFTTYCVCLELRSLPSTGVTRLPRYADHALGLPVFRALSLCTCCRQYPGVAAGRNLRSTRPAISAFPDMAVGSACTSSVSRLARRSLALRPAHSRLQPLRYLHDCSDCFRLERLPGGACTHWKAPPLHGAHPVRTLGESDGLDDRRHKPRRRELLNQVVRLLFRNISPGGSNSTAHLLGLFCCYTKLISQKFGLQLHHFVYVLGIH